jgi:hypothetical protein
MKLLPPFNILSFGVVLSITAGIHCRGPLIAASMSRKKGHGSRLRFEGLKSGWSTLSLELRSISLQIITDTRCRPYLWSAIVQLERWALCAAEVRVLSFVVFRYQIRT